MLARNQVNERLLGLEALGISQWKVQCHSMTSSLRRRGGPRRSLKEIIDIVKDLTLPPFPYLSLSHSAVHLSDSVDVMNDVVMTTARCHDGAPTRRTAKKETQVRVLTPTKSSDLLLYAFQLHKAGKECDQLACKARIITPWSSAIHLHLELEAQCHLTRHSSSSCWSE